MGSDCRRKLLVDFGTKYVETASEIRKAIDANDFEQIHSLIHNLKGLAGNLEAGDIQAAAVEMEKLVKGHGDKTISNKELNQKFAELEKAEKYNPIENLKALHEFYPQCSVYLSRLSFNQDWQEILPRL